MKLRGLWQGEKFGYLDLFLGFTTLWNFEKINCNVLQVSYFHMVIQFVEFCMASLLRAANRSEANGSTSQSFDLIKPQG